MGTLVVAGVLAAGCAGDESAVTTTTDPGPGPQEVARALCAASPEADPPGSAAPTVRSPSLTEVSGLVAGRRAADVWWAHNDSGGEPLLHAVGPAGEDLGQVTVEGAANVDWEDLAVGPGPTGDLLYVGDIGNNVGDRATVPVEVVDEPEVPAGPGASVPVRRTIELVWPDGPRDAEVLLVDPRTSELVVVTKTFAGPAEVLVADGGGSGPTDLEVVGTVDLRAAAAVPPLEAGVNVLLGLGAATGGDVTADGDAVIVRTYGTALVWPRRDGQSLAEAIVENEPCEAPTTVERQGEAIAIDPDGSGYRTIGEGSEPPVNRFEVTSP